MRYSGIIKNDIAAGEGVCVTFFTQGCSFHCKGCHNPETWDFNGGKEFTDEILNEIIDAIHANNIIRNFCIMGGEPLCPQNYIEVAMILKKIREIYPNIKIYIWTGYTFEKLLKISQSDEWMELILSLTDVLIDGPYVEEERDITLPLRGSRNQRIINLTKG